MSFSDSQFEVDLESQLSEGSGTIGSTQAAPTSPIAPRFLKETQRGVKRRLDLSRYRNECNKKKVAKPPALQDEMVQTIDSFIFHHVKVTIVSRFHFLSKTDLRDCLIEFLPEKRVVFPSGSTRQYVGHVVDMLIDDYYKYYKNIVNKLRFDVRQAMELLEPVFFAHPKKRSKETRGRDRLEWYQETTEVALLLEQCVKGIRSVEGFRARAIKKFRGYLYMHDMHVEQLTEDEIKECSKQHLFYIMSIMASSKTDLFVGDILQFDNMVRPSIEATILHAWYIDMWDTETDDPSAWSTDTISHLITLVEEDRKFAQQDEEEHGISNQQVYNQFLLKISRYLPSFKSAQVVQADESSEDLSEGAILRNRRWV